VQGHRCICTENELSRTGVICQEHASETSALDDLTMQCSAAETHEITK